MNNKLVTHGPAIPFAQVQEHFNDGATLALNRGSRRPDLLRLGPNEVHAIIHHPDGSFEDLGISYNLLTNLGRDWLAGTIGGFIPAGGAGSPATATSSTSLTATATPWTASNFATPQLGIAGMRIYASVTSIATAPVYMNVGSNTTSVATGDQWWNATDGTGTTPASTNAFILGAGGMSSARFMAITTDSGAASAADTALTTEISSGGCARALATYAHTFGAATFTLVKAFSVTSTFTNIHKMAMFTTSTLAATGIPVFEAVLNQDATVGNGDTLTITETVTLSG